MRRRFRYSPEFAALRDAIIARDARKVGAVVRREPDAGAEVNAREAEYQGTPLAAAVRASGIGDPQQAKRQRKMVQLLLQRGADANLPHDQPWATPLAWALRQGQPEIAELLKPVTSR